MTKFSVTVRQAVSVVDSYCLKNYLEAIIELTTFSQGSFSSSDSPSFPSILPILSTSSVPLPPPSFIISFPSNFFYFYFSYAYSCSFLVSFFPFLLSYDTLFICLPFLYFPSLSFPVTLSLSFPSIPILSSSFLPSLCHLHGRPMWIRLF